MEFSNLVRKMNTETVEYYCNTCLLSADKKAAWRTRVTDMVDANKLGELKTAMQVINELANGTMESAQQIYETSGHFDRAMNMILEMVSEFSPKGDEFREHLKWSNIKRQTKMKFSNIRHTKVPDKTG